MNEEVQLRLQAYLDGELSAADSRRVRELLSQDPRAVAILDELRGTSGLLKEYEAGVVLPESREFYWSKIERGIRRSRPVTAGWGVALWRRIQRMLVPAASVAAVVIAVVMSLPRIDGGEMPFTATSEAVAFTYQNYETGTTLVWLDFSAPNNASDAGNENQSEL